MNEINLKEFEFEDYLLANVALFDEVLADLGEPPLFENRNFAPCEPLIFSHYLTFESTGRIKNTLPIRILFEGDSLRIDIDGIPEIFEWAKEHIDADRDSVVELIENLFTGYVLVESRGASRFVQMFDSKGFFVNALSFNNWLHFLTGLYLIRYKNFRRIYLPLFTKK